MSDTTHIRNGFSSIRPYLYGPTGMPELIQKLFDARVIERHDRGPTLLQVGDSLLWIESGELPAHVRPWVGSIYAYVPDVDAVYARALELGASSLAAPEDKHYGERQAGFTDPGGNTWWVSTFDPTSATRIGAQADTQWRSESTGRPRPEARPDDARPVVPVKRSH